MEAGVPSAWLRRHQFVDVERVGNDEVVLGINTYDPVTQLLDESPSCSRTPVCVSDRSHVLAWPSELDLMARIADLQLRDRWSGWLREPFTSASQRHVSVYTRCSR